MAQDPQTSQLLREAEEVIVQLRRNNDACNDYIEELTSRLQMEVEHIRRLGEKIDKLEAVLSDVSAERDDVRIVLQSLRNDMQKIRDVAAASLKSLSDGHGGEVLRRQKARRRAHQTGHVYA